MWGLGFVNKKVPCIFLLWLWFASEENIPRKFSRNFSDRIRIFVTFIISYRRFDVEFGVGILRWDFTQEVPVLVTYVKIPHNQIRIIIKYLFHEYVIAWTMRLLLFYYIYHGSFTESVSWSAGWLGFGMLSSVNLH